MQPWEREPRQKRRRLRAGDLVDHFGFMVVVCTVIYGNLLCSCVKQNLKRSKVKNKSRSFYESAK
jgi:hypothetical protein